LGTDAVKASNNVWKERTLSLLLEIRQPRSTNLLYALIKLAI
jgi:hypothetical protein